MSFSQWLAGLGLAHYEAELLRNDIDLEVAPLLTEADLEKLGLSLGHRKKFLRAAAQLGASGQTDAGGQAVAASPAPDAERRQLTVMFCDLADSTRLSVSLDPEELRRLIQRYQALCAAPIERYGGFIAKYMGDGVLVYFGYPGAHEDDAERAVRAARDIVAAIATLADSAPLRVRIGIATGLAVVGDLIGSGAAQEQSVVGETPNLAARLQGLAAPNGIVISALTRQLAGGMFIYEDMGERELKGFPQPVRAWQVSGECQPASRFAARGGVHDVPLVGREEELGLLLRRWGAAQAGEGQAVLLCGEPGIGKSRLAAALAGAGSGALCCNCQCSPHLTHTAFHPFIEALERQAGITREMPPAEALAALRQHLAASGLGAAADLPLFAALLSLPADTGAAMSPQRQREQTIAALVRLLLAQARQRPLLLLFEDVHWADPTSLDVLDGIIDAASEAPLLAVITYRPEFQAPWSNRAHVTTLTVNRLSRAESLSLVNGLAGPRALPEEMLLQIAARTDGIPLFIEELTQMLVESATATSGSPALPVSAIPVTLRDSLMARLDRLGRSRELAQIGAVIGRSFERDLIARVSGWESDELQMALDRLQEVGMVQVSVSGEAGVYRFKHALVQDTAYESLLISRRQELHRHIAETIEAHFAQTPHAEPEILAHHFTQGRQTERAIHYLRQAGEKAKARSAMREARHHFRRGLELVAAAGSAGATPRLELDLLIGLGPAQQAVEGLGSTGVETTYLRARELAAAGTDRRALFTVLWGLWLLYNQRGALRTSYPLARELLDLSRELDDPGLVMQAYHALWPVAFFHGDFAAALDFVALGEALYDAEKHRSHRLLFGGHDPLPCGFTFRALALWLQGSEAQAVASRASGIEMAEGMGHPFSLGLTSAMSNWIWIFRRDPAALRPDAERLVARARAQGFRQWQAYGEIQQGWAMAMQGECQAGLALIDAGIAANRRIGGHVAEPFHLGLRAEAQLLGGDPAAALESLAAALAQVETNDEHWWEPELLRLAGDCRLALGRLAEADKAYAEASAAARRLGAWALVLRAATSHARRLAAAGEAVAARTVLDQALVALGGEIDAGEAAAARRVRAEL